MSILLRSQILTKINNWITTNGNKEITGAQLNEILTDMVDSGFLQLDEVRTAQSILYQLVADPNDWNGGVAPATQNLVNDELAERLTFLETTSYSQNVAYFGPTGSDVLGEFELGNPAKPFLTFQAAVDAVPLNNGRVISLGGTFTEALVTVTKNNFYLEFANSQLNGEIWIKDCTEFDSDFGGSTITNTSGVALRITGGAGFFKRLQGGHFISSAAGQSAFLGGAAWIINSRFEGQGTAHAIENATTAYFSSCRITSEQAQTVYRSSDCVFSVCRIENLISGATYNTQAFNTFKDCLLRGTGSVTTGEGTTGLKGRFENCIIRSTAGTPVNFNGSDENVEFVSCKIVGDIDTFNFINSKPDNARYLVQGCRLYCGSGEIYNDSSAVAAETWQLLSVSNAQNKATSVTNPAYFDEQYSYVNTTLPDVQDI